MGLTIYIQEVTVEFSTQRFHSREKGITSVKRCRKWERSEEQAGRRKGRRREREEEVCSPTIWTRPLIRNT